MVYADQRVENPHAVTALRLVQRPDNVPAVEDARILIVDDDAVPRRTTADLLERAGFWRVDVATGGREAIAAMRRRTPAVVLLDVHMPGFDGRETLRVMALDAPRRAKTSVLALSGDASPDTQRSMLEHGADDFLLRPCPGAELVDHVRDLATRAQSLDRALAYVSLLGGFVGEPLLPRTSPFTYRARSPKNVTRPPGTPFPAGPRRGRV